MTIEEKILSVPWVKGGDEFSITQLAPAIDMHYKPIKRAIEDMTHKGVFLRVCPGRFRIASSCQWVICEAWGGVVGPEHFGPREWA